MRVLYCAIDQVVPGTTGGSVHVRAVADGLAALGHEVHVLAQRGPGGFPRGAAHWHPMRPPLGSHRLRFARARRVATIARALKPDVVMERYFNFGGEGMHAASRIGALAVLEVNAPIVDYPGSPKRLLDRLLIVEPMRRWRDWQCRTAGLVVSPSRAVVPAWLSADRVVELEWGADTDRFRPGAPGPAPFERAPDDVVVAFAGAFRSWHGAIHLVEAMKRLEADGPTAFRAVLAGDGPELPRVRDAARGLRRVLFTGPLNHDAMPALLASADIGAAPFDVSAHAPLSLAFYWSPLKIFEYMASGLPVAAPDLEGIRRFVTDGAEGMLYDPADSGGLARTLVRLKDAATRRRLGTAARERAVTEFSWAGHCRRLEAAIQRARAARRNGHAISS